MRRAIGVLAAGLTVIALGCASGNDRPATDGSGTSTTAEGGAGATTTTAGAPFGGATTTTPAGGATTTAPGDEGGDAGAGTGAPATPTGGGGSGSVEPTSPVDAETPSDLADALGGQCTGYADTGAALQQPGTAGEGTCLFAGEIVNLYNFTDLEAQRAFVAEGAFFDCGFIVAFGGGGATWYVAGDGWIARPGTEGVARQLAEALDGEAATYACEA